MTKIICNPRNDATLAYYATDGKRTYWLFDSENKAEYRHIFSKGVSLDKLSDCHSTKNKDVNRLIQRILSFVKYIEDENEIVLTRKRRNRADKINRRKFFYNRAAYQRTAYRLIQEAI